jgi:hypothetical protein
MTLLKFIVYSLLIFWIFCINKSFEASEAFLTSSSSWDINKRIPYKTSSNLSKMIFLNKNLVWTGFLLAEFWFGLLSTWALKNEKNILNQINVDNLEKLENFPLATLMSIVIILLVVS